MMYGVCVVISLRRKTENYWYFAWRHHESNCGVGINLGRQQPLAHRREYRCQNCTHLLQWCHNRLSKMVHNSSGPSGRVRPHSAHDARLVYLPRRHAKILAARKIKRHPSPPPQHFACHVFRRTQKCVLLFRILALGICIDAW